MENNENMENMENIAAIEDIENVEDVEVITAEELEQIAGGGTGAFFKYTVVKGDSLWRLAKRFSTTVDTLARINNIKNKRLIRIGQVLLIPYPQN